MYLKSLWVYIDILKTTCRFWCLICLKYSHGRQWNFFSVLSSIRCLVLLHISSLIRLWRPNWGGSTLFRYVAEPLFVPRGVTPGLFDILYWSFLDGIHVYHLYFFSFSLGELILLSIYIAEWCERVGLYWDSVLSFWNRFGRFTKIPALAIHIVPHLLLTSLDLAHF